MGELGDQVPLAVGRRAARADQAPDSLIERCRTLVGEHGERPERPTVRPDERPVTRTQLRPDRARPVGPPSFAPPPFTAAPITDLVEPLT